LNSITNPVEKADFFAKHKTKIYEEYQANINKRLMSQH